MGGTAREAAPLLTYLGPDEQLAFARAHGLAVDSRVTVTGEAAAGRFMEALAKLRDDLTDARFEGLVASFAAEGHVLEVKGTVRHAEVLGDVLEGLIVTNDETGRRFKFKTMRYICRTLILRAFILARGVDRLMTPEFGVHFLPLVRQWTRPSNHALWRSVLWGCALRMPAYLSNPKEASDAFCARGGHLNAVDAVLAEHEAAGQVPLEAYARTMDTFAFHHALVLVLGPVGSGKSTWARRLVRAFPGRRLVHVDGDSLLGDTDGAITRCLGAERNPLTWSLVLEAWLRGQVPVVSCGGGQLCEVGSKRARSQIYRRHQGWFGASRNVAICTAIVGWDNKGPAPVASIEHGDELCESLIASQRSDADERVEEVVRRRLRLGEWHVEKRGQTEDVFVASIVRLSRDNHIFTEALVQDSLAAICLSAVTPKTYADEGPGSSDFPEHFTSAMASALSADVLPATVHQVRALIPWFGTTKHVTLSFGEQRISGSDLDALRRMLPKALVRFRLVALEPPGGKEESTRPSKKQKRSLPAALVVDPSWTSPGVDAGGALHRAHVTLQSGPHLPKSLKELAAAVYRGDKSVSLPVEDPATGEVHRNVTYCIPNLDTCPIHDLAPLDAVTVI